MSRDASADQLLQGNTERLTRRLRLPYVRHAAPELLETARSRLWEPNEALRVLLEEEVKRSPDVTRAAVRPAD